MEQIVPFGGDLSAPTTPNDAFGLESFTAELTQGPGVTAPTNFKAINIVTEGGVHYATVYACQCIDGSVGAQQLAIWLSQMKETDQIVLTVLSMVADLPPGMVISLMTALNSTKAQLTIQLDQVVCDGLAYFYLIPEKICKGTEGALFIPSYMVNRDQDASGPIKAMHDYFKWMVAKAVERKLLTSDEGERLDRGAHVAVPDSRFTAVKA
jgi:hypothetical protein